MAKRAYHVQVTYQSKGNRYERTENISIEATSAGRAALEAYKRVKGLLREKKNGHRLIEREGGGFFFGVHVGAKAEKVKDAG